MKHPLLLGILGGALLALTAGNLPADKWHAPPDDLAAVAPAPLPLEVPPANPDLHYTGRFDRTDPREALCAWSATAVMLRFRGTAVNVRLGTGANRFEAVVDGVPVKILSTPASDPHAPAHAPAPTLYALATGLPPGEHRATVFKCTEARVGNGTFGGFQLEATAAVLPAAPLPRKIEVIGDSISCGYGNEAASPDEPFSPATENAWWSYGAIAARALGAEYECIAWSGRKMYPDNTIPEVYDAILPRQAGSHWPGDAQKPDVILINLGTNEFFPVALPDRARWVAAYLAFVGRLRRDAPRAMIYCAVGSMLVDGSPGGRPSLSMAREWVQEVVRRSHDVGDPRVRFLEFAPQQASDGYGANAHPSVRTHQVMAERLIATLRADLHW